MCSITKTLALMGKELCFWVFASRSFSLPFDVSFCCCSSNEIRLSALVLGFSGPGFGLVFRSLPTRLYYDYQSDFGERNGNRSILLTTVEYATAFSALGFRNIFGLFGGLLDIDEWRIGKSTCSNQTRF